MILIWVRNSRIYKPNQKAANDVSNIATDEWLEERRRRRAEMFGEPLPPVKAPEPPLHKPEDKGIGNLSGNDKFLKLGHN
jgi:hypothetical protein